MITVSVTSVRPSEVTGDDGGGGGAIAAIVRAHLAWPALANLPRAQNFARYVHGES